MSTTTPIVDFVRRYAQSGTSRLHMPGHKGQSLLGFEPWDITEIKGADELYGADGIIAQSEANATRLFGTVHTYYSTEGSSQCIRAMLCLALQAAPAAGQRPVLLAARNAHKALLYAAALLDFDIQWLWPAPQDAGALCSCPVSAAKLTGALQGLAQQGKRPFGVYITSPDYLGGVQDIAALAEVCKDFGVPLLVDNAHGAYLRFLPQGGQHPIVELMQELSRDGKYEITSEMKENMKDFYGNYASEGETAQTIKDLYEKTGYVIDTHTAVAATVLHKYRKATGDETKAVVASTASPFKFTRSVMDAIDKAKYDSMSDFELVDELSRIANVTVPNAIEEIRTAPVLHDTVCDKEDMKAVVMKFLGI